MILSLSLSARLTSLSSSESTFSHRERYHGEELTLGPRKETGSMVRVDLAPHAVEADFGEWFKKVPKVS